MSLTLTKCSSIIKSKEGGGGLAIGEGVERGDIDFYRGLCLLEHAEYDVL